MKSFQKILDILFCITTILLIIFSFKYRIAMVSGSSMNPTLRDGQFCLIKLTDELQDGDIIVIDTKDISNIRAESIIKRYQESKSTEEGIYVLGDNYLNSYDSRKFGLIDRKNLIGRVVVIF